MKLFGTYVNNAQLRQDGQHSHMAIDYDLLLREGTVGIAQRIKSYQKELDDAIPAQMEKSDFYNSCLIALDGLNTFSDRYAALAQKQADCCDDPIRKQELLLIADNCRNVPRNPAKNFYQAMQSVHFMTFCLSCAEPGGLYQLGRPDRYLIDFYRKDIAAGTLTREFALTLLDCIGILYNEYIGSSLACGFMVGGRDEHGNNIANELTYLAIESIGDVKMIYPGIGLCCNQDTPQDLMELACEMLSRGHSHPALFNDDVIIKGLQHYGLPYHEACAYVHSTCVEITPCASSACWVASPYTNLMQILLNVMGITPDGEGFTEYTCFDDLETAYFQALSKHIRSNVIEQNHIQLERSKHSFHPLLSCVVNDCLSQGVDIEGGGARYNWIMPSFVGVANLADAFEVLQKLVFEQKRFTQAELAQMLRADFHGYEAQRQIIENYAPKYGNDTDEVDQFVTQITQWINHECEQYTTSCGGRIVPSLFCWVMHDMFGLETMATPDGRRNGFPLGDGSGPAQGREKEGPTASILSSTKWEHSPFIGGVAVNMKFSKKLFQPESKQKLLALLKIFLQRGGFEFQVNVVDQEVLLKARENPELYQDLVVRIGGYSDFFVRLSPTMQAEVIARSAH